MACNVLVRKSNVLVRISNVLSTFYFFSLDIRHIFWDVKVKRSNPKSNWATTFIVLLLRFRNVVKPGAQYMTVRLGLKICHTYLGYVLIQISRVSNKAISSSWRRLIHVINCKTCYNAAFVLKLSASLHYSLDIIEILTLF